MGLHFNYDYWNNMETPSFILCTVDKNRIGTLNVSGKHLRYNHEIPEISFRIYQFVDGEKNPHYDKVLEFQYVLLPEIGYFQIMQKPVVITDRNMEYKEVTAQSAEIELGQKYLNTFSINMGTVESIDGVCLYQAGDSKHSLLNLVLEKLPSWSIDYVDPKIATLQRSFEVDNQDVYSFLTSDVSKAFGCIFIFDTLHNTIHVYEQDSVSEDTNIVISFQNLAKKIKLTPDADSVKTCVTLVGSDSLTIRELNMGYDRIYNFDYFVTPEYMNQELIDAYKDYQKAYEQYNKQYTPLLTAYQDLILEIARLDHEMLPETPLPTKDGQLITTNELAQDTEVWKEYCLTELETYKKAYEGRQSVLMQKGFGSAKKVEYDATEKNISYSADASGNTHMRLEYKSLYVPVYLILQHINSEIATRKAQIQELENNKKSLKLQMENIISLINIQKNFTKEQWLYLSKFIREETLSDSNYVVTRTMTKEEELEMKQAFLDFGKKELSRVSQPQFSFTMDMANIFAFPEFRDQLDKFDLFNYITVLIRDDYYMKVKILSFDIDFEDRKNFSVTFGSIYKYKNKDIFTTAVDAMAAASSASTSVSFNKFQWNNGTEDAFDIKDKISSGLINAGVSLSNSRSTMEIDERGLFMNNDSDSEHPNEKTALTGSNLLFTTDNWQTVRTALGRIEYIRSDGTNVDTYGLIAETVLSGYIGGSLIEGNTINGGTINGNNIHGGTITGTNINNGNGTFSVDEKGNMISNSGTFKGTISASEISGSSVIGTSINNGNGTFFVDSNGNVSARSMTITGGSISITNSNDTSFSVDQNGKLTVKNAVIEGNVTATGGSFSGNVNATSGTFDNVIIKESCTVAGQSITGTIGNNVGWNGSAIQNDYIGNLSAGKLTIGTVGRPYIYNGVSITDAGNNFGSGNGDNTFRALHIYAQKPIQAGGSSIGSNDVPFAAVYSSVFKGSLSSSSSKETKDNIKAFDTGKCIGIIKNTEVVSYNYKNDIKDNSKSIREFEEEIKRCLSLKEKEEDETLREIYSEKIAEIKQNIEILKSERETFPETRYGFISEDAPWELVSMDRKTVDTYSAVAMCFGAIQEIDKRIMQLEGSINNT